MTEYKTDIKLLEITLLLWWGAYDIALIKNIYLVYIKENIIFSIYKKKKISNQFKNKNTKEWQIILDENESQIFLQNFSSYQMNNTIWSLIVPKHRKE